jgi:hypothetical protein
MDNFIREETTLATSCEAGLALEELREMWERSSVNNYDSRSLDAFLRGVEKPRRIPITDEEIASTIQSVYGTSDVRISCTC